MMVSETKPKLPQDGIVEQALEITKIYEALSTLQISQRKAVFRTLSAEAKSDLWRMHMKLYLSQHPELTKDQKGVVLDGVALIAPQLFEVSNDSAEWLTKVQAPLESLRKRALEVFPPTVVAEIFTQLGKPSATRFPKEEGAEGCGNCSSG
jgi:hypothetical protein